MIEWVEPNVFWLMVILPLLLLIPKKKTMDSLFFPLAKQIQNSQNSNSNYKKSYLSKLFFWWIIWFLLCATLAQPIIVGDSINLPREGRNILLAVDISGSMKRKDMVLNNRRVNRLVMVKAVVDDFVQKRKGDKLGLILFGTQSFLQSPLTYDIETVRKLLAESVIGLAGENTAIGDAIGLAVKHDEKFKGESILILLTDGQNTAGQTEPIVASRYAKQTNLKIYTIGIGKPTFFSSGVDKKTLHQIAKITNGKSYIVQSTNELKSIYKEINQLEPTEDNNDSFRITQQYYWIPLTLALTLMFLLLIYLYLATIIRKTSNL